MFVMEAPWVRISSKLSRITFEQQPPRLVRWGFHASPLEPLMIGLTEDGVLCRIEFACGRKAAAILGEWETAWPRTVFVEDKKATRDVVEQILGKTSRVANLKLQMTGTKFQQAVW